jgi:thiamine-phosphate pyrophosphorylase
VPDHRPGSIERILDAAANRAREGLRVVEDYVRFVLADDALSHRARDMRHRVTELARRCAPAIAALRERDTPGDLGADPASFATPDRAGALDVVTGALKRSQEALRSLSEFARVSCAEAAAGFESLRYEAYDLEKATLAAARPRAAFASATVALIAELEDGEAGMTARVAALVRAGCHVLALDGSAVSDRAFARAASGLREVCDEAGALLLVTGRADVARASGADGVLLGAAGLPVAAAARVVGETTLVVCAARTTADADSAIAGGAHGVFLDGASADEAWLAACPVPCFVTGFASVDDARARAGVSRIALDAASTGEAGVQAAVQRLQRGGDGA